MKSALLTFSSLATIATATALPRDAYPNQNQYFQRATNQSPKGYAPSNVDCPSTRPAIRSAGDGISTQEKDWLQKRKGKVAGPMRDFLSRAKIDGLDTGNYLDKLADTTHGIPNVALAFSGGGYRAMLNGAGVLSAMDDRVDGARDTGLGGLLQSSVYFAGLSGGGWLTGSIFVNNFTSIQDLVNADVDTSGNLWQLENSVLKGPDGDSISILDSAGYYSDLASQVGDKEKAGYDVSITDFWGRGLSYQFVNASNGGPGFTWSSIADDEAFSNGDAPMPILVADARDPGEKLISLNSTVFEFTPWELGTFDPTVFGFAPLKYLGSKFDSGKLPDSEQCIVGFDNAGFVMGTSSSLFNQIILNIGDQDNVPQFVTDAIRKILTKISNDDDDIADYNPNPFKGFRPSTNAASESEQLTLVDGGEDLQNIPFQPVIQPEREVDVVFAVDSSADTTEDNGAAGWPNGTAMVATYERNLNRVRSNGSHFPYVPDQNTFVNKGLNNRPVFFGCDVNNMTGPGPLVVYIPNAPYVFLSNTSTFGKLDYTIEERNAMIQNGFDVATQGNSTAQPDWPTCVSCAVLARSFERERVQVPSACSQCFDKYCWDGSVDSSTPPPYIPQPALQLLDTSAAIGRSTPSLIALTLSLSMATLAML